MMPQNKFIAGLFIVAFFSCTDQSATQQEKAPVVETVAAVDTDYDFTNAESMELKKKLREISGLTFYEVGKFAAVQDELGEIYILDQKNGDILETVTFAGKGDYEDIAVGKDFFYVLESSGKIIFHPRKEGSKADVLQVAGKKKKEFESMFLQGNRLVLLCKSCRNDDESKEAFCFDLRKSEFETSTCLTIDLSKVIKTLPAGTLLKPSSATINPADNKLYVLCSIGKTLLRCDIKGVVEKSIPLDDKLFRQPEGICFTPDGTMYISNEGAGKEATIVKILKKKPGA